jgi:hypothetical protein
MGPDMESFTTKLILLTLGTNLVILAIALTVFGHQDYIGKLFSVLYLFLIIPFGVFSSVCAWLVAKVLKSFSGALPDSVRKSAFKTLVVGWVATEFLQVLLISAQFAFKIKPN